MNWLRQWACVGLLIVPWPALAADSLQAYVDEDDLDEGGLGADLDMAPQVALAAAFTMKGSVETPQPRVYLGDLASCSGSPRICAEAYAIDLGASPEPGHSIVWHSDKLAALLAKEWPGALLKLHGAKLIKVSSTSVLLDEGRLLAAVKSHFEPTDSAEARVQVQVEHVALLAPVKVHAGELLFDFPEWPEERLKQPGHRVVSGTQRMTVICRAKTAAPGEGGQSFVVNAQFRVKERHWIAARSLAKGTLLQASDLNYDWVPADRIAAHYADTAEELVAHRLRHDVATQAPVLATDVETPRLLKRGQMATLQLQNRGLNVSSQVRILADASAGQQVEAVYPSTKKKLRVRAIDSHTVQLAF